ncbi:MAG: patatin-like phospholipase family protein [Nanoarchaeota archaeon]
MKKIGLVLSGGGARGLAHIGVIKELEKLDMTICAIAGCSMGAVIGAFYASGKTAEEIEEFVLNHKIIDFLDISISRQGLNKTDKLEKKINEFIGIKTFRKLNIPLYINATNISKGKERVFSTGNIFRAIRASISVPGIFAPLKLGDDYYIDGGVLNQTPFSILPKDITHYLIVNVFPYEKSWDKEGISITSLLENSLKLMQNEMSKIKLEKLKKQRYAIIEPKLGKYRVIEKRKHFEDIIRRGQLAAKSKKRKIIEVIRD